MQKFSFIYAGVWRSLDGVRMCALQPPTRLVRDIIETCTRDGQEQQTLQAFSVSKARTEAVGLCRSG